MGGHCLFWGRHHDVRAAATVTGAHSNNISPTIIPQIFNNVQ